MLRIGPAGNSDSFYASGHKHTYEAASWLHKLGLNAFEYSFGRGVSLLLPTAQKIGAEMKKYDIQISAHAPYYINLVKSEPEIKEKNLMYILQSITALNNMGGRRLVVHPGTVGALMRDKALGAAKGGLEFVVEGLEGRDYLLCIETMGKKSQIGSVNEALALAAPFKDVTVCLDFGHINCVQNGLLKTKDDYKRIIDAVFNALGEKRAKTVHIHFSKIMFGNSGEIKHLTFEDKTYGPEYEPLANVIEEYKMSPTLICESDGTMAEDALYMKLCHTKLN